MPSDRLWHQLTLKLFEFFDHPLSKPCRVVVFQQFVRDFESKLNQQKLVELGTRVSKEITSAFHFMPVLSVRIHFVAKIRRHSSDF